MLCEYSTVYCNFTFLFFFYCLFCFVFFPRKSVCPGELVPESVGKLMLQIGPPRLGDASSCTCSEMPVTEVLLNGS